MSDICPVSGESYKEELLNHWTHLIGLILSLIGLPILIFYSVLREDPWTIASFSIYGSTLVLLYLASTFYHGCTNLSHKSVLQVVDHACIYLLIAGCYTPFALGPLRESNGWTLLAIEWTIAVVGIGIKIIAFNRFQAISLISYLVMGWLVVLSWSTLVDKLSVTALILTMVGGLFYTIGSIFFVWEKLPFNHGIWHLFVLCGSVCHYFAILML
ncbi:MAG: hemolysin III family protein [Parachlamydiaceae bacterium]|nr:hemolysin III family protein [Parachlamydiaceae bacterium]